jgi:hypothetical protein
VKAPKNSYYLQDDTEADHLEKLNQEIPIELSCVNQDQAKIHQQPMVLLLIEADENNEIG